MSEKLDISSEEVKYLNPKSQYPDVMDKIIKEVGEMGTYQKLLFASMFPFGVFMSMVYVIQMFIAATPQEHWCRVPELQHLEVTLRRNLSIPGALTGNWNRCVMFDANWTAVLANLTPPDPGTPTIPCRDGWEFLYNDIPYITVVSEREWVCDKAGYAPTAQSLYFLGSLIGCLLFGWMGDAFGRLPALMGANLIGCVGGVASVFTTGLWDFAFCRFLVGMSFDCCFVMIYIIVLEYVGPSHRTWTANMSIGMFATVGSLIVPVLALWLLDWRRLILATSLPMLVVIAAPWTLPESARWLASTGKTDRAVKVLKKIARVNKKTITEDVLEEFIMASSKKQETDESLLAVFRNTRLRNVLIILTLVAMISNVTFDAVLRMSEAIGDNFFVTYSLSSVSEVPALTIVTLVLDRWGRRFMTSGTLILGAVSAFTCSFLSTGTPQMVLAVLCRFFFNMSLSVQMQLGAEILPTGVRAAGTSLLHVSAFLATTLSPFIVYSGQYWRPLPLLILTAVSALAGGLSLLLPETKGKTMPQTIADGERLIREGMLCGKPEEDREMEDLSQLRSKKDLQVY